MIKCCLCFVRQLPSAWVPGSSDNVMGNSGFYKTEEAQLEEQHIALAQSSDAVTVFKGKALCMEHLVDEINEG